MQLLIAGYRKLAFHVRKWHLRFSLISDLWYLISDLSHLQGIGQYPHCGLMWSLVYHTRPRLLKHAKPGKSRIEFEGTRFEERLKQVVKSKSNVSNREA